MIQLPKLLTIQYLRSLILTLQSQMHEKYAVCLYKRNWNLKVTRLSPLYVYLSI